MVQRLIPQVVLIAERSEIADRPGNRLSAIDGQFERMEPAHLWVLFVKVFDVLE